MITEGLHLVLAEYLIHFLLVKYINHTIITFFALSAGRNGLFVNVLGKYKSSNSHRFLLHPDKNTNIQKQKQLK